MKHELWYSVVVRDRYGKVISRERRKSKSFLKQWLQLMCVQMTGISQYPVKDLGGTSRTAPRHENNFWIGYGQSGLMCGIGDTPVTVEDYQLEAQIASGYGADQFEHLGCLVSEPSIVGTHFSFLVSRSFVNWSGDTITVKEIGVYTRFSSYYMCGTRDVLDTPLAVPYGGGITVEYTLEVAA